MRYSIFLFTIFLPFGVHAELLFTNRIGDTRSEIRELQMILNKDVRTQVAQVGPGSPGQETTYFGAMTKNAVIRFQEIYKNEVLIPAGVTEPTGIVGNFTRKKMNALSVPNTSTIVTPAIPQNVTITIPNEPPRDTTLVDLFFAMKPEIFTIFQTNVRPGDSVEIAGIGFESRNNAVYFSDQLIGNFDSDGLKIVFTVPNTISSGSYNVSITNSKGSTLLKKSKNHTLIVGTTSVKPLIIKNINLTEVSIKNINSPITVFMEGGTSGLTVLTSLGEIAPRMQKENTFEFSLADAPLIQQVISQIKTSEQYQIPISVQLRNSDGVSTNAQMVYLVK